MERGDAFHFFMPKNEQLIAKTRTFVAKLESISLKNNHV